MTSKCGEFFETRRPLKIVGMVIGGIILAGLMAFLFGWVVMLLWNWIMPSIFGVTTITYWQGFGIFFLAKILFGFGGDSHSSTSGSKKKKKKEGTIRGEIGKEIKEEIISKVQAGERVAELAEQYAVSTKTIYTWLRQDTGEAVVSVLQYNKLKRENEELKRLIGELTLTMHLQKKSK